MKKIRGKKKVMEIMYWKMGSGFAETPKDIYEDVRRDDITQRKI